MRHWQRLTPTPGFSVLASSERSQAATMVLVAEPKVLGRVRDNLDNATAKAVTRTIDKNLTRHDADHIRKTVTGDR